MSARGRSLLLGCFLVSGACGLVYEVTWSRALVLVVGNTPLVHALTVAAFLVGLGLGSRWGGRLAVGSSSPLRTYAALEGLVALLALAMPLLRHGVRAAYRLLVDPEGAVLLAHVCRGMAVLALLAAPALVLGATFPVVVAAWRRREAGSDSGAASGVGLLYGINTLGAVGGALLAGFVLVPSLGMSWSTRTAAIANLVVALVALSLARTERQEEGGAVAPGTPGVGAWWPVWLYGGGAFLTIAAQLLWTRLLALHLRGVTYTFTTILAVFIGGLALGDLAGSWWVSRGPGLRPRARFGTVQVLAGLTLMAALAAVPWLGSVRGWLEGVLPIRDTATLALSMVVVTSLYLLPAVLLLGALFPLAVAGRVSGWADAPGAAARLYAAGSLGGGLGALVGGLVVVPTVGLLPGLSLVALAMVGLGAVAMLHRHRGLVTMALLLWLAGIGLWLTLEHQRPPLVDTPVLQAGHAWGRTVVAGSHREGLAAIVTVLDDERTGDRILYTDEFAATSTARSATYMRLLGHLPVLLAASPDQALVLCYGTGTTAGSVATHRRVERLDLVEISRDVLEVSPLFEEVNRGVLEDPRVHVFVQDGREFLATATRRWDVVSLEPLLPTTPQAVHFYTVEFYREALRHLRDGGVLCQWSPVHACELRELQGLLAAFLRACPDTARLWFFEESLVLTGGPHPAPDPAVLQSRGWDQDPALREDLEALGLRGAGDLLGCCILGPEGLRDLVGEVAPVTDDRPWIEFYEHGPALARLGYLAEVLEALVEAARRQGSAPLGGEGPWRLALEGLEARAGARRAQILARQGRMQEAADSYRQVMQRMSRLLEARPADPFIEEHLREAWQDLAEIEGGRLRQAGDLPGAIARFQEAVNAGERPQAALNLAVCLREAGRGTRAREVLDRLLVRYPRFRAGWLERARLREDLGDAAGAAEDRWRASRLQPGGMDLLE